MLDTDTCIISDTCIPKKSFLIRIKTKTIYNNSTNVQCDLLHDIGDRQAPCILVISCIPSCFRIRLFQQLFLLTCFAEQNLVIH